MLPPVPQIVELRPGKALFCRESDPFNGTTLEMLAEMPLNELRHARGLLQKMLAEALHIQQPSIAKLERRTDMYVSTPRSHIEAMGGLREPTL
jgi:hypothetical protein